MSQRPLSASSIAAGKSTPVAGVLAWLLPGMGHWYLGLRRQAIVVFVTLTVTFWGGVALGGVRSTVNIQENGPWLAAQLCAGPQTVAALMWSKSTPAEPRYEASYPAADIAVVYTGIAGLLNLLVIIDALARSEGDTPAAAARRAAGGGG